MKPVHIHHGDSREVIKGLADNSIDAVVCDPPYALVSIVKRFGGKNAAPAKSEGASGVYKRASAGFMGQAWDTGETAFDPEFWGEVWRVLKPGGHLIAASGTRTYHRLACAVEDAGRWLVDETGAPVLDGDGQPVWQHLGFEVRDMISWLYGSGFPKSHDVSKGIDRAADYRIQASVRRAAVEVVEAAGLQLPSNSRHDWTAGGHAPGDAWWTVFKRWLPDLSDADRERVEGEIVARVQKSEGWFTRGDIYHVRAPATPESAVWAGWGTALKPACEPWVLARKPLDGTVAANVLAHGTGALNIDGCRIEGSGNRTFDRTAGDRPRDQYRTGTVEPGSGRQTDLGRWPANVIHDGSEEVVEAFPAAPGQSGAVTGQEPSTNSRSGHAGLAGLAGRHDVRAPRGDEGSAARFFYSAKADADDRMGSNHPTVKPIDLMRYLVRLVTPPGGVVLDPFAGSGSTGVAAMLEGFESILIEREAQYVADIERKVAYYRGEGRLAAQEKGKVGNERIEDLPLFGGEAA